MQIKAIYLSTGHNFFGRHGLEPEKFSMESVKRVLAVAGMGLTGDRFFNYKKNYHGQATFFAMETYEEMLTRLALKSDGGPQRLRRNLLCSGIELQSLINQPFEVQGVLFQGMSECSPCYWMDQAVGPGTEAWLKGRGGLRARVLTTGWLQVDAD
jgi:MOSC domain-containing protein YiiM